ncbi:MAG: hypothetical protein Q4G55_08980 [bacterium]|nr:hypothetical protein [bacterium]
MKTRFVAVCASVALAASAGAVSSPWVYLPEESVISNNNAVGRSTDWVLNVSVVDSANHTLAIGNGTPGDAYCFDEAGAFKGGKVLDLSESIADISGTTWTIVHFKNNCFWKDNAPFRTFIAPRELTSIHNKIFGYALDSEEIVDATFDCPYLTQINNGTSEKKFVRLHFKVPNCVKIENWALTRLAAVDVSDWDLSGVQLIGQTALPVWDGGPLTGTLKLPSLRELSASVFSNAKYTRMEWGNRHNTLTSVGANAINSNVTCEEMVIGCAEGCTFAKASVGASSLSRVWMTGAVPVFSSDDIVFGTSTCAEKSMVFYVPDTEAWATIRVNATELTESEREEFKTAHPDWEVPFGVVAADVFHTQNAQYIGTADLQALGVMCKVSVGNRSAGQYGDALTVTTNGVTVTDGEVPYGTIVTVTAASAKDSTVVSWEGRLPDGTTPTGNLVTFKATENVSLFARFSHAWEFDAEAVPQTITDGYWTLVVTNTADRSLQVGVNDAKRSDGRTTEPWAFPATIDESRCGMLDLSGPIYTSGKIGGESERWSIEKILDGAFSCVPDNLLSTFVAPTTLKTMGMRVFRYAKGLTEIVFNCPKLEGTFCIYGLEFQTPTIRRLVLNAPNLVGIDGANFHNSTLDETDLSTWDLTGVKTIAGGALEAAANKNQSGGPTGDLILPKLETAGQGAFDCWTRVASVALGTDGTLKSLGKTLFWNQDAKNGLPNGPKKIDFGKSWDFTVDAQAFYAELPNKVAAYPNGQPLPIEEVWFAGKAPSVEALDNILALRMVAEDGTKPVKIFAPMMDATWKAVCRSFTDEEATVARTMRKEQNLRVIGVYETQDGRRAAWLVQNPAFPYRSGFVITIR